MSNTVTARDLIQLVNAGYQPVTQFNEEFGVYSEENDYDLTPGMRVRLIEVGTCEEESVKLVFDLGGFEEHNRPLEHKDYYAPNGKDEFVSWSESPFYPADGYYPVWIEDEKLDAPMFELVDETATALFLEWKEAFATGRTTNQYVQWLEEEVRRLRTLCKA